MDKVTWFFGEVATGKSTTCFGYKLPSRNKKPKILPQFIPTFDMTGAMAMYDDGKTDVVMVDRVHGDIFRSVDVSPMQFLELTYKENESYKGIPGSYIKEIRFTSCYLPDECWPKLDPALVWSRIDCVVYCYFALAGHTGDGPILERRNMELPTKGRVATLGDLRKSVLARDHDAVFNAWDVYRPQVIEMATPSEKSSTYTFGLR